MVLRGNRNLTADRWVSIGNNTHFALDTVYAFGLDAIPKQFRIKWFVREQLFQQFIQKFIR